MLFRNTLTGTAYVDLDTIEHLHENLGDEVLVTVAVGPRPNHWYIAVWVKRADLAPILFPEPAPSPIAAAFATWKPDPLYIGLSGEAQRADLQRGGA